MTYKQGQEISYTTLQSAGEVSKLLVDTDRKYLNADGQDLAYIMVVLCDSQGRINHYADQTVAVTVDGPAVLQGFGSADPKSEASFSDKTRQTFDGYVLAVIRSTEKPGLAKIRFESDKCESIEIEIEIK